MKRSHSEPIQLGYPRRLDLDGAGSRMVFEDLPEGARANHISNGV